MNIPLEPKPARAARTAVRSPRKPSRLAPEVLILTAAEIEYETVIDLAGVRPTLSERRRSVGARTFLDLGLRHCTVWAFQCKKGSVSPGSSLDVVKDALNALNPKPFAVINTGLAFGLNPAKQDVGDVLVSEQIRLYEPERRGSKRLVRGDKASSSLLLGWFRDFKADWAETTPESTRPRVHFGLMLTGEKLVDDPLFVTDLRTLEPEAIGGEMEGAGVYAAAQGESIFHVHWIVAKGICDWGIGKGDSHQSLASRNAIDLVFHVLDQPVLAEALKQYRAGRIDNNVKQSGIAHATAVPVGGPGARRAHPKLSNARRHMKSSNITQGTIEFSRVAEEDCRKLNIDKSRLKEFVVGEASRHPALFRTTFTSIPLVFGMNVLLLSWDSVSVRIERVQNRERAYPFNDAWTSCLAAYRRATLLSYRSMIAGSVLTPTEMRRSLNVYRRLVATIKELLTLMGREGEKFGSIQQDLDPLLEEAELAFSTDNFGAAVARMENVLSTAHKLILECTPTGPSTEPREIVPDRGAWTSAERAGVTVLIVDDNATWLEVLGRFICRPGVSVVYARTPGDALRAMVEQEFDLVITDLLLSEEWTARPMDGREIVLAAKRSSSRTEIVVCSAYVVMSEAAELLNCGADDIISKDCEDLIERFKGIIVAILDRHAGEQKRHGRRLP